MEDFNNFTTDKLLKIKDKLDLEMARNGWSSRTDDEWDVYSEVEYILEERLFAGKTDEEILDEAEY